MAITDTFQPGELVERIEKVLRRTSPPGQLGDQDGIDSASLCEFHDAVSREPVVPGSRCGFLEDAEHLEAAALGEGSELGDLPFTGLVDGRDSGVDGGALSQLNPLGSAAGNRLIFLVRYLSKTDFCSTGTESAPGCLPRPHLAQIAPLTMGSHPAYGRASWPRTRCRALGVEFRPLPDSTPSRRDAASPTARHGRAAKPPPL